MAKFEKVAGQKRRNVFLSPADIALINNQMDMDRDNLAKRIAWKKTRNNGKKGKKNKNSKFNKKNKGQKKLKKAKN